jgi:Flp pilus assembly protein TadG
MKHTLPAGRRRAQRGAIAIEAALVLPILVVFVLFPTLFWTYYFYQYSAAQKAVHDAGLYLSTAPKLEMTTAGADGGPAALTLARKIIATELAGMSAPDPGIVCSYRQQSGVPVLKPCTLGNNQDYKQPLVGFYVSIDMNYIDPLTGTTSDIRISPYANIPYTGD